MLKFKPVTFISIILSIVIVFGFVSYFYFHQNHQIEAAYIHHNELKQLSLTMLDTSDYLTNEARKFAVTGELKHLKNYWDEVHVEQKRDKVIKRLRELKIKSKELDLLVLAKSNSDDLINTEIHSMRLVLEAQQLPKSVYPDEVSRYQLTQEEQLLNKEQKMQRAQMIMFDNQYELDKKSIIDPIKNFTLKVITRTNNEIDNSRHYAMMAFTLQTVVIFATLFTIFMLFFIYQYRIRGRLKRDSSSIASSLSQILVTIEEQERTAISQSASIKQINSILENFESFTSTSDHQAKVASDSFKLVRDNLSTGVKTIDKNHGLVNELQEQMQEIESRIRSLSSQLLQIQDISILVKDLSAQINLLALNAAVEASRAGEHGSGFNVVAVEIRKLVDESKKSAERIKDIIFAIQRTSNFISTVVSEGMSTVEELSLLANQSNKAFTNINNLSDESFANVQEIMNNTREQLRSIQQVVESMNDISINIDEMSQSITQGKTAVGNINDLAKNVETLI